MRDFVQSWTHGAREKTWVAHATLALAIGSVAAAIGALAGGAEVAGAVAFAVPTGYYLIRELEQLLYGYLDGTLDPDWLDHVMDVVSPACSSALLALAISAVFA